MAQPEHHPFKDVTSPYNNITNITDKIVPLGDFTALYQVPGWETYYKKGKVYIEKNSTISEVSSWENPNSETAFGTEDHIQKLTGYRPPAISYTFPTSGTYKLIYTGQIYFVNYLGSVPKSWMTSPFTITFTVAVVENHLPLKTLTIKDVIDRLCLVAEPLREGETPMCFLNEEQAKLFDKIQADEFVFTKQTFREALQAVGKQIHGEPRITPKKYGTWRFEISFDMYQQQKKGVFFRESLKNTASVDIEKYATHLDANAENLINSNKRAGQVIEPAKGMGRTVRVENMGARVEDGTAIIETQQVINEVLKLECYYNGTYWNLTPYVFESTEYSSQLSTYSDVFPYSRAYGLKYTRGKKNIEELFFKIENGIFDTFKNYSIVNILRKVTGNGSLKIDDYTALMFRVTYIPLIKARVLQNKSYIGENEWEYGQVYNQQSNLLDIGQFGESMKGAIARTGNTEISKTFYLATQREIPKIGEMYDDDYYITNVNTEILPVGFKCTIILSKDYNRLSEYTGIPNQRRFSQVSETEAYERDCVLREFVVIGDYKEELVDADTTMITSNFWKGLQNEFEPTQNNDQTDTVTAMLIQGKMKGGSKLNTMLMAVSSSAYGNSVSFRISYADNYSAGSTTAYQKNGDVEGIYQMETPYSDYYGRMYSVDFRLLTTSPIEHTLENARRLPFVTGNITDNSNTYDNAILRVAYNGNKAPIISKDSREQISLNLQIDFVTNRKNIIIGNGLANNNVFVVGRNNETRIAYILPKKIPKFATTLREITAGYTDAERAQITEVGFNTVLMNNLLQLMLLNLTNASGKAWAVVTRETTTTKKVEDLDGVEMTETKYSGGELLIGENVDIKAYDIKVVYFTNKRYVYSRDVWKDEK